MFAIKLIACSLSVFLLASCAQIKPEVKPIENVHTEANLRAGDLRIAANALQSGDIEVARNLYQELTLSYPDVPAVWLGLGDSYFLEGKYEQAKSYYQRAQAIEGNSIESSISLARVAVRLRDFDTAISSYKSVLQQDPDNAIAYAGLGVSYDLSGQPNLAQETYKQGLAKNPGNDALIANLGLSLALNGKPRNAVNVLLGNAGVSDTLPQRRDNLALAYGMLGRDSAAEEILLGSQTRGVVQDNLEFYEYLRNKIRRK